MNIKIILFLLFVSGGLARATFSICAVDSKTGEVGSAGASCVLNVNVISDVHSGKGVVHTQAVWDSVNQANAGAKLAMGWTPKRIINWLQTHDAQAAPYLRQYGIVAFNAKGKPKSSAFTGVNCADYKNHITGRTYSIQGNRLLGQQILDAMERGFKNTKGSLAHKLMAAMQGANIPGADRFCSSTGLSSRSAFLIVSKPNDTTPYINLVVTNSSVEPIDILQSQFDELRQLRALAKVKEGK